MNMYKPFLGVILLMAGLLLIVTALVACQPASVENSALQGKLEAGEALRIMPLGDSITEGFCDKPSSCKWPGEIKVPVDGYGKEACKEATNYANPEEKSYRAVLHDKLIAQGIDVTYVGSVSVVKDLAHEGHSGFTLFDIDYCIQNAGWLDTTQPDIILLHIGTNDALRADEPEEMIINLEKLLNRIYQIIPKTTEVLVAQVIPTKAGVHVGLDVTQPLVNDILTEYNARIPDLVAEFSAKGMHVSLVDMRNTVQSMDEYDEIGLHPNPVASERMADVWFEKIMEILGQ